MTVHRPSLRVRSCFNKNTTTPISCIICAVSSLQWQNWRPYSPQSGTYILFSCLQKKFVDPHPRGTSLIEVLSLRKQTLSFMDTGP